jgi:hypothetical protein
VFEGLFTQLRVEGVPVAMDEWLGLQTALGRGLHDNSLAGFYLMARALLVKDERHYDAYDIAFGRYFSGLEPIREDLADEVWDWLRQGARTLNLTPEQRARLDAMLEQLDIEEIRRRFEERLAAQDGAHHGGSEHIGTGGTSPFGHSGYHPGGIRLGGQGRWRSAAQVAGERRWREYRADTEIGVRQFGVALRKLRQLSTRVDGPATELDIDGTIRDTADHAGQLRLAWRRPRRNAVRVVLLLDIGGSMDEHIQVLDQLFSAVHQASHFRDLQVRFFHNCVYDRVYLDAGVEPARSEPTMSLLARCPSDYKLVVVGDACMGPGELTLPNGAIDWWENNEEPGYVWLTRLRQHFTHTAWLNPVPEAWWEMIHGAYTLQGIRRIFPMYELSLEGLEQAVAGLMVRR